MEKRNDFSTAGWARTAVLGVSISACGGSAPPASAQPQTHDEYHAGHAHGHPADGHHQGHHHRFNDASRWAKQFDDPARDEWQRPARVIELLALAPGMTAADVGAGTGYFTVRLSKAVGPTGKVLAEDIEPDMVKWLSDRAKREELANVEVVLGAPDDPKLPQSKVDRILVVDTWHHIDDRPAFARKLAQSLAPKGVVTVVDFTLDAPQGPPKAARLSPESIMSDLTAAGLEASVVKDAGLPHQYVVRGVLNR